jgi:branched-chain amino acid transport system ATP-binding protein
VQDVLGTIRRLKAEGLSVIIVEQNAETALSVADRVYVLDRGHLAWAGTAAALRDDPVQRRELLGA